MGAIQCFLNQNVPILRSISQMLFFSLEISLNPKPFGSLCVEIALLPKAKLTARSLYRKWWYIYLTFKYANLFTCLSTLRNFFH